ncbi:MAG: hypothetical protein WC527_01305 [Candidatus Margulisiibacteriota bacterium]
MAIGGVSSAAMLPYIASAQTARVDQNPQNAGQYSSALFSAVKGISIVPEADRQAVINFVSGCGQDLSKEIKLSPAEVKTFELSRSLYAHILGKLGYLDNYSSSKKYSWDDLMPAVKKYKDQMKKCNIERNIDPSDGKLPRSLQQRLLKQFQQAVNAEAVKMARKEMDQIKPEQREKLQEVVQRVPEENKAQAEIYMALEANAAEENLRRSMEIAKKDPEYKQLSENPNEEVIKSFEKMIKGIKVDVSGANGDILQILGVNAGQLFKADKTQVQSWAQSKSLNGEMMWGLLQEIKDKSVFISLPAEATRRIEAKTGDIKVKGAEKPEDLLLAEMAAQIKETKSNMVGAGYTPAPGDEDKNKYMNVSGALVVIDTNNRDAEKRLVEMFRKMESDPKFSDLGIKVDDNNTINIEGIGEVRIIAKKLKKGEGLKDAEKPLYKQIDAELWKRLEALTDMGKNMPVPVFGLQDAVETDGEKADISFRLILGREANRFDPALMEALLNFKEAYIGVKGNAVLDAATVAKINEQYTIFLQEYADFKPKAEANAAGKKPPVPQPEDITVEQVKNGEYKISLYWGSEPQKEDKAPKLRYFAVLSDKKGNTRLLSSKQNGMEEFEQKTAIQAITTIQGMLSERIPGLDNPANFDPMVAKSGFINEGFLGSLMEYNMQTDATKKAAAQGQAVPDIEHRMAASRLISEARAKTETDDKTAAMVKQLAVLCGDDEKRNELLDVADAFTRKMEITESGKPDDWRLARKEAAHQAITAVKSLIEQYNCKELARLIRETGKEDCSREDKIKMMKISAMAGQMFEDAAGAMTKDPAEADRFADESRKACLILMTVVSTSFEKEDNEKSCAWLDKLDGMVQLDDGEGTLRKALDSVISLQSMTIDKKYIEELEGPKR